MSYHFPTFRAIQTGRRFCHDPDHRGRRWLPAVYFNAAGWKDSGKTIPVSLQTRCDTCQRRASREYMRKKRKTKSGRKKINSRRRRYAREKKAQERRDEKYLNQHPKLPAGPFRAWLASKVQEYGIGNVASAVGVDPRRISILITGWYTSSYNNKHYEINFVQLGTVDRYMIAFHEYWWELYPNLEDQR